MRENLYLNRVVRECQITSRKNSVSKVTLRQIDVYCSLLEEKRHQSLAKPGKINFKMIQSKLYRLYRAKQKQCRHDAYQHMCDLWHVICHTTVKQLCCTFFEKLLLTTVWNKIGWKTKFKRKGGENGRGTNVTSRRRHVGPSMTVIRWHFWPPEKPQEF